MTKTEYYALKGMVSEMTPEQQTQIEQARQATLSLIKGSDVAVYGVTLAMLQVNELIDKAEPSHIPLSDQRKRRVTTDAIARGSDANVGKVSFNEDS